MKSNKLRNFAFTLHRYIGLAVGLILVIVGLTGSLLVFAQEIDHFLVVQDFGNIIPQRQMLSPASVVDTVKAAYASQPDTKLVTLFMPSAPDAPYILRLLLPNNQVQEISSAQVMEVFVNPYTGAIMGQQTMDKRLTGFILELHFTLLAGKSGIIAVGIAAFVLLVLSITGLLLWPGWRKLIAGFKIKLDAHQKRVNFDIHKLVGIITVVFMTFTAFTGFCWNFNDFTKPIIYAITFSPNRPTPVSKLIPAKSPLEFVEQLKISQAVLPSATLKSIDFPLDSKGVLSMSFKLPEENLDYGQSLVFLDQYTGKVLRVDNALKASLGDRILNSFPSLHYGTFWGLPSRILYVLVGLAPLILFITGIMMYRYRHKTKSGKHNAIKIS